MDHFHKRPVNWKFFAEIQPVKTCGLSLPDEFLNWWIASSRDLGLHNPADDTVCQMGFGRLHCFVIETNQHRLLRTLPAGCECFCQWLQNFQTAFDFDEKPLAYRNER